MGQRGVDPLFVSVGAALFPGQIMTDVLFFLDGAGVTAPLLYVGRNSALLPRCYCVRIMIIVFGNEGLQTTCILTL